MSSGSPSQIVHEVGGPPRSRPSSRQTGWFASLPGEMAAKAAIDCFEAERIVAEELLGDVQERSRRLDTLAVDLLGGGLAVPHDPVELDLHEDLLDLFVGRAGDGERLLEPQCDRAMAQSHAR